MTKTVSKLDYLDRQMIQLDVETLKSFISQIVSYAQKDYPCKGERLDAFNGFVEEMFIEFADEFQEAK